MRAARWTTPSLRLRSVVTGTSNYLQLLSPAPPFYVIPSLHNAPLKVRRLFGPILYFAKIRNVPVGLETLTNARGNIFIFFLLSFVNCRLKILPALVCVVKSPLSEELAQDKRRITTEEHALTRLYELCWSVILLFSLL